MRGSTWTLPYPNQNPNPDPNPACVRRARTTATLWAPWTPCPRQPSTASCRRPGERQTLTGTTRLICWTAGLLLVLVLRAGDAHFGAKPGGETVEL